MTTTDSTGLELFRLRPNLMFSLASLKEVLANTELTLFFAKLYKLDADELGQLLSKVHDTTVIAALLNEGGSHSAELQDYIVEIGYEQRIYNGEITFVKDPPMGEILAQMWESLQIEVASSIQEVAEKLGDVIGHMPGKQGKMVLTSMMVMNQRRPTVGDHRATIQHARVADNLVILDVSGSMTRETVTTIIDEVVALGYMANAHLAIVSNTTTHWSPGEYSSPAVLKAAEFAGTQYETLAELLNREWGVVVTIADYDSSLSAKNAIADCTGKVDTLLDISLVTRPTFLGEVVGQLAAQVKPLLIAQKNLTY